VLFITVFYPSSARSAAAAARAREASAISAARVPELDKENQRVLQVLDYPVIVIDNDYESPRIGGILIRALVEELRSNDQRVLCGLNLDDARAGARTYVAASAVLISIDGSEEVDGEFQRLTAFLREQSARRANLPVFLYGERRTIECRASCSSSCTASSSCSKTPRASSRGR
jgi:hypothetical protein